MGYGTKDLKRDLTKKVESLEGNEEAQQEFLAQLLIYSKEMTDPRTWTDGQKKWMNGIAEWLEEYFVPLDENKKLDKELSDERLEKYFNFHIKKQMEAGKDLDNKGLHSLDWKQNYLFQRDPDAPYAYGLSSLLETMRDGKYAEQAIEEAYGQITYLWFLHQDRYYTRKQIDRSAFDDKRAIAKGNHVLQSGAMLRPTLEELHYKNEEHGTYQYDYDEAPTYHERYFDKNRPEYFEFFADNLDLSFIQNKQAAREIRSAQDVNLTSPYRDLANQIREAEERLNSKEFSRWRDSGYMKDIKKNMKNLRDLIEINGTGSPENANAIAQAYEKLQKSCDVYLETHSGKRSTDAGVKRFEFISQFSGFLQENHRKVEWVVNDAKNDDIRKKQQAGLISKPLQGPGKTMAKLLAMNELGMDYHTMQENPGALEREFKKAETKIEQAMRDMQENHDNRAMQNIIGTCKKTLASINMQTETVKTLGFDNPGALTQGQVEIALKAPVNQEKVDNSLNDYALMMNEAFKELNSPALEEVNKQMPPTKEGQYLDRVMKELEPAMPYFKLKKDERDGYDMRYGVKDMEKHQNALAPLRKKFQNGELNPRADEKTVDAKQVDEKEAEGKKAAQEKRPQREKMDYNALREEFQNEHAHAEHKKNIPSPVKKPELAHAEPSKERNSLTK